MSEDIQAWKSEALKNAERWRDDTGAQLDFLRNDRVMMKADGVDAKPEAIVQTSARLDRIEAWITKLTEKPKLTVSISENSDGLTLARSDQKTFQLVFGDRGDAVLFYGAEDHRDRRGLVDLDVSITNKRHEAVRWALAYPDRPA